MKKWQKILMIFLAIIVALIFAKNAILKVSVEKGVELVTGLPMKMEGFNVGIFKSEIGIKKLKVFNPKGFPDKLMVHVPEVYVDYDLSDMLKKKVHLEEVRFNLEEFVVIKDKDGKVNINSLKIMEKEKTDQTTKKSETKPKGEAPEIQIDNLQLRIYKVTYKDYSKGSEPVVKEFKININENHRNITNPNAVVALIVSKVLTKTTIASLANVDVGILQDTLSGTVKTAEKTAGAVVNGLKKTGESLINTIKSPFRNTE